MLVCATIGTTTQSNSGDHALVSLVQRTGNVCDSLLPQNSGGRTIVTNLITRRAMLEQIGAVGGIGATYMAMEALGLAIPTPAGAENFALPAGSGKGKSVVILGAGIAGLVSAYELQRAGFRMSV